METDTCCESVATILPTSAAQRRSAAPRAKQAARASSAAAAWAQHRKGKPPQARQCHYRPRFLPPHGRACDDAAVRRRHGNCHGATSSRLPSSLHSPTTETRSVLPDAERADPGKRVDVQTWDTQSDAVLIMRKLRAEPGKIRRRTNLGKTKPKEPRLPCPTSPSQPE